MDKGRTTRAAILDVAILHTVRGGLAGLTFGGLADELGMSKGGLGAHFRTKEALQLAVLAATDARFDADVVDPALTQPRGRAQMTTLFARYLDWMEAGCVYSVIAQELAVLPTSVVDTFRDRQRRWQRAIVNSAGEQRSADVALQFTALALAYQQAVKVFDDTSSRPQIVAAFERALDG